MNSQCSPLIDNLHLPSGNGTETVMSPFKNHDFPKIFRFGAQKYSNVFTGISFFNGMATSSGMLETVIDHFHSDFRIRRIS